MWNGVPLMTKPLTIAVLPGDHIGPEIVDAALHVLEAAGQKYDFGLTFQEHAVGHRSLRDNGVTITDKVVAAATAADGIILGPCDNGGFPPVQDGGLNVPGVLRNRLDLYANLRPSKSHAGVPGARPGLDVLVVRENTEGFYPDRNMHEGYGEFSPVAGVAIAMRRITAHASHRIAKTAFEWAARRRRKVGIVNKKHILRMTDGLFCDEALKVAQQWPDIECTMEIVDALNADLYTRPARHDVLLMTNMFGDILSNLCAALAGGLGLGGGLNAGETHAMANASHGSAPDIAGQNKANPISMIVSGAMLLDWLGVRHGRKDLMAAAEDINAAVNWVLSDAKFRTADVGGTATMSGCALEIARAIKEQDHPGPI
jgi:3-isopropylmalate dehydrogenase